ncbi:MAG: HD-GYP domain-containing protein [Deefgea sp.]
MYKNKPTGDAPSTFSIHLFDMISALSTALDLLDPALSSHHRRTCLIVAHIARTMELDDDDYQDVFGAAIFHDIGAIGLSDRLSILDFEEHGAHSHARLGGILLSRFPGFCRFGPLVHYHHVQWGYGEGVNHGGKPVPLMSHLIHLADRIEILAQGQDNILGKAPEIVQRICDANGRKFHPMFVEAFCRVAKQESFWLDIFSKNLDRILMDLVPFDNIDLDMNQMLQFAQFFALVIDSRSHFTATHSAGVAITAETIARHLGMSEQECIKMRMAGYLHDLGKLAIPSEFIERQGKLEEQEMALVRSHSYLTLDILSSIKGLEDVAEWAAFHHERLDGSGYPFHRTADQLSLGARIMAVADMYTALTEDRPYRAGMCPEDALRLLDEQKTKGKLDPLAIDTIRNNLETIEVVRIKAQEQESLELKDFWRSTEKLAIHRHKVSPE